MKKKIIKEGNKNSTEYHLTAKGLKLNKILYEMAVFGLEELECSQDKDLEIINLFKKYYANFLGV